jgi:hypothetical protein
MFAFTSEGEGVVEQDATYSFVRSEVGKAVAAYALPVEIESLKRNDTLAHELAINDECNSTHLKYLFLKCHLMIYLATGLFLSYAPF